MIMRLVWIIIPLVLIGVVGVQESFSNYHGWVAGERFVISGTERDFDIRENLTENYIENTLLEDGRIVVNTIDYKIVDVGNPWSHQYDLVARIVFDVKENDTIKTKYSFFDVFYKINGIENYTGFLEKISEHYYLPPNKAVKMISEEYGEKYNKCLNSQPELDTNGKFISITCVIGPFGYPQHTLFCKKDFTMIQKYDNSPACVKPSTAQKLLERDWTKKVIDEITFHPDAEFSLRVGYGEWYEFYLNDRPDTKNIEKLLEFDSVRKAFEQADYNREIKYNYGLIPPHSVLDLTKGLEVLSKFQEIFPVISPKIESGKHFVVYDGKPYVIGIELCPQGCPRLR